MAKVLLISDKTLKENSFINDNVGNEFIKPAVELAQDIDLQQFIGSHLYRTICNMVTDGSINTNEDYKLLLDDYIIPFLNFKVMSEIIIPITFKTRNLGTINTNDTFAQNTVMKDAQTISQYYDTRAQSYANRLTSYLQSHRDKYKEYCKKEECSDLEGRNVSYLVSNIYLG